MAIKGLGFQLARWLSERVPAETAFGVAERISDLYWMFSRKRRLNIRANLSLILDEHLSDKSVLVREIFRNFGRYLTEFFTVHRKPAPEILLNGFEHLEDVRRHGRGVIALSAHLGNWEMGAIGLRRLGIPTSAVVMPHEDKRIEEIFERQRRRYGVKAIPLGVQAGRLGLRSLQEGDVLCLVGDRQLTDSGIAVRLGRRRIVLPRGPAILSLRSLAPIVPSFCIREGRRRFRICVEPPIVPASGKEKIGKEDVFAMTQAYACVLERYVRQFSEQWLLFEPLVEV